MSQYKILLIKSVVIEMLSSNAVIDTRHGYPVIKVTNSGVCSK